jgi:hypothetical protein
MDFGAWIYILVFINEEKDEIIRYAAIGGQANMILSTTKYPQEAGIS